MKVRTEECSLSYEEKIFVFVQYFCVWFWVVPNIRSCSSQYLSIRNRPNPPFFSVSKGLLRSGLIKTSRRRISDPANVREMEIKIRSEPWDGRGILPKRKSL